MKETKVLVQVWLWLNETDGWRTESHYFVMDTRCFESADEIWGHIGGRLCANRTSSAVGDFESAARNLCSEIKGIACELLDSPSVESNIYLLQVGRKILLQESRCKAKAEEPGPGTSAPPPPPPAEGFFRMAEVEEGGEKVCVICLEKIKAEVPRAVLPCCHEYQYGCILQWFGVAQVAHCVGPRSRFPAGQTQSSIFSLETATFQ